MISPVALASLRIHGTERAHTCISTTSRPQAVARQSQPPPPREARGRGAHWWHNPAATTRCDRLGRAVNPPHRPSMGGAPQPQSTPPRAAITAMATRVVRIGIPPDPNPPPPPPPKSAHDHTTRRPAVSRVGRSAHHCQHKTIARAGQARKSHRAPTHTLPTPATSRPSIIRPAPPLPIHPSPSDHHRPGRTWRGLHAPASSCSCPRSPLDIPPSPQRASHPLFHHPNLRVCGSSRRRRRRWRRRRW